ncbi:precorrin-2 dehydrogenase [Dethiosulfatarculus sandiegensis]|uniref:Precorrin-2 dehydrogenase n=2 Tax=Dethiosulfatarculus sandiegensis TaxID=1429043 RepID=A0A0D2J6L5_9BACT|nr:precorrin-2 dehydrogenase [Dethiosulfatarculus sandiegensis]
MQGPEAKGLAGELGGIHWGFLPAFLCLPLFTGSLSSTETMRLSLILMASLMASYDLASRRIPNVLTGLCALYGLLLSFAIEGPEGLLQSFLGGLSGFGLMAVFFFIGAVGAGDVKALGALGALLNPLAAFYLFVLTTLTGGVLALAVMLAKGRGFMAAGTSLAHLRLTSGKANLPYGLAIWGGSLVLTLTGLGL